MERGEQDQQKENRATSEFSRGWLNDRTRGEFSSYTSKCRIRTFTYLLKPVNHLVSDVQNSNDDGHCGQQCDSDHFVQHLR